MDDGQAPKPPREYPWFLASRRRAVIGGGIAFGIPMAAWMLWWVVHDLGIVHVGLLLFVGVVCILGGFAGGFGMWHLFVLPAKERFADVKPST
jgi:hypothetical protein